MRPGVLEFIHAGVVLCVLSFKVFDAVSKLLGSEFGLLELDLLKVKLRFESLNVTFELARE